MKSWLHWSGPIFCKMAQQQQPGDRNQCRTQKTKQICQTSNQLKRGNMKKGCSASDFCYFVELDWLNWSESVFCRMEQQEHRSARSLSKTLVAPIQLVRQCVLFRIADMTSLTNLFIVSCASSRNVGLNIFTKDLLCIATITYLSEA